MGLVTLGFAASQRVGNGRSHPLIFQTYSFFLKLTHAFMHNTARSDKIVHRGDQREHNPRVAIGPGAQECTQLLAEQHEQQFESAHDYLK